jgi:hypothetical protein
VVKGGRVPTTGTGGRWRRHDPITILYPLIVVPSRKYFADAGPGRGIRDRAPILSGPQLAAQLLNVDALGGDEVAAVVEHVVVTQFEPSALAPGDLQASPSCDDRRGLGAMAAAWNEQQGQADLTALAFDERFGLLVEGQA